MFIKQMVYKPRREVEILASGAYDDFKYYVVSYGTHPCCYIDVSETPLNGQDYLDIGFDDCHGGLTFSGKLSNIDSDWLIGWDYAHCIDYVCGIDFPGSMRWSTEELINDCKYTIQALIKFLFEEYDKNG